MTSPQTRKDATFERDVVAYLRSAGHPYVERSYVVLTLLAFAQLLKEMS